MREGRRTQIFFFSGWVVDRFVAASDVERPLFVHVTKGTPDDGNRGDFSSVLRMHPAVQNGPVQQGTAGKDSEKLGKV